MAIGFKKFIVEGDDATDMVIDYLVDPHARGDYYSEGGQAVLRWLATPRLQRLFALGGPIVLGRTAMRMLFEGRHPVTGEVIRHHGPTGKFVGAIDVTLSPAPKSVSVLWALADPETRHEIERMVWVAADLGIAELMEKPLVRQRVGRGRNDVVHEAMADIVGVQTLHTTARLSERGDGVPDPQLHVHSLLFGAVDAAGMLRALDSHQMLKLQLEIDAYAGATLAEMFRLRGFPIVRTVDSRGRVSWELAEIPDAVLRLASSRRAEITDEGPGSLREQYRAWCREQYGAEREPTGPAWDAFLASHRGPKAGLAGRELTQAWADQYESAGWARHQAQEYIDRAGRRVRAGMAASDDDKDAIERFRQEFLADICRENALVPESYVDAMTFEKAKGLIDVTTALSVVGAMFSSGDLLVTPDGRVTTLGVLAAEQRARSAAHELMDTEPVEAPSAEAVQRAIEEAARQGRPFDEHQEAAVRLATSGRRFVSITGQAGTGKGVTSGVIAPLWQALGREVIALAVAGRTAQQAGHDARADLARTIDGFVASVEHGRRLVDAGTLLIVDEAAMIDHVRYAALLDVAARAGATVIQVGDDRQLSPVGPGGLWTLIHAAAQARGLAAELRTVRRAKEVAEAQAWTDVREGRVLEALNYWQERGRLRLYDSRSNLLAGMVAEWWADEARGVMVLDTSNAERDVINRLAQEQCGLAGELGAEVLTLENGCQVRPGDYVIFREIIELPDRVPRIENGTEATVASVDEVHDLVELILHEPHGERTVTVGREAVLNLAYARHIQLGQGMTVDGVGQVGVSSRTDREHFYVMVSRARSGAVIHAVRSEVAALAAPGLGPVTERQEAALEQLGVLDVPEDWTWADASVEIDALMGSQLGGWAMRHLTETMQVEPLLAAHLVTRAIARRQADTDEAIEMDRVAPSVRAAVATGQGGREETDASAWETFLAELADQREALEARQRLAQLLSREGRKEAVGDQPVAADTVRDEDRQARRDRVLVKRDSRPADVEHAATRAWRVPGEPHVELPLPHREPDLAALRFDDGVEVARGQVIRFGHPDWLAGAARQEVQPGDLGVVFGCHRGGVTWDYASVELVGGRQIHVWQTAQAITVEPDLAPSVVRDAVPRPDQRDPAGLNVFELVNGTRLVSGDRVRFVRPTVLLGAGWIDAGTEAMVQDVERHRHNRVAVELDDGRRANAYSSADLEIVRPAQAPTPLPAAAERPLPATKQLEQVARREAIDQVPRALAMYDAMGQLHVSTAPEQEVASLWQADPRAAIVVQTWAQVAAVRQAIDRLRVVDAPTPLVLLADAAYRTRIEAERSGEPAPNFDRAYVLAELDDRHALSQALSIARESHLVIAPPDRFTANLQAMHARQMALSFDALGAEQARPEPARPEPARQAALLSELREADRQRAREAERDRTRTAEREVTPS